MTYRALNTVTKADVKHTREAISDISNVGLMNWEGQSLTCQKSYLYFEMLFAVAERNSGWDENWRPFNCDLTLGYTSKSNGDRYEEYGK